MPVDGLVLHMKAMGISKVVNFPFPTPPDPAALRDAEALLVLLGALDSRTQNITKLGRTMAQYVVNASPPPPPRSLSPTFKH
jgi:ATP-dependent RNA helicase DHX37/DHR1